MCLLSILRNKESNVMREENGRSGIRASRRREESRITNKTDVFVNI